MIEEGFISYCFFWYPHEPEWFVRNCTGGIAFFKRGKQQEGNLTFISSPCGRSPTIQGSTCPSSWSCQRSSGSRWSSSSIPSPLWWALSWIFDTEDLQLSTCALIFRWRSLEALWGFLLDFPSWDSLMLLSISHAVQSMFLWEVQVGRSGNKSI